MLIDAEHDRMTIGEVVLINAYSTYETILLHS